jgi:hypothetical protein
MINETRLEDGECISRERLAAHCKSRVGEWEPDVVTVSDAASVARYAYKVAVDARYKGDSHIS